MFRGLLGVAIALTLTGTVAACDHSNGGGGGGQKVDEQRLPKSNDVNPSTKPDTFIDDRSKQRHRPQDGID